MSAALENLVIMELRGLRKAESSLRDDYQTLPAAGNSGRPLLGFMFRLAALKERAEALDRMLEASEAAENLARLGSAQHAMA